MVIDLNPQQRAAVTEINAPLLVLSGAGSGKTRVITEKIAHLITRHDVPARRILALTFTNKAAKEMLTRARDLLPAQSARGLKIGTFHQFGLNIIRKELKSLPLRAGFSILDEADSRHLITDILGAEDQDENIDTQIIKNKISHFKNNRRSPQEALSHALNDLDQRAALAYAKYQQRLKLYNAVDFDDLIYLPLWLLQNNYSIRQKWQSRIEYVLVDEYQDTNACQYELFRQLVEGKEKFTVVGDDDQSIYGWRGACPDNLHILHDDYPTLKIVKLEQNYRSFQRILKVANAVIGNNPHLFEKKLWSDLGIGDAIEIMQCKNEEHEAQWVAQHVMTQKLKQGQSFDDFCILYRSNFQARILELQLQALSIPYQISGTTSFFARAEIKDVLAYLKLMLNPDDDNAFLRVINTPKRDIGATTLEKLSSYAQLRGNTLFTACSELGLEQYLPAAAVLRLRMFHDFMHESMLKIRDAESIEPISQLLENIHYREWLVEQSSTPKAAEKRWENVQQLLSQIQRMLSREVESETSSTKIPLETVLQKLMLIDLLERNDESENSGVQLMTLHSAKGLEFPNVYIIGVEDGILPHRNHLESESTDGIEEERRLFYVGMTRAQRKLTLTLAQQRRMFGEDTSTSPSRFLTELPTEDIQWLGENTEDSESRRREAGRFYLQQLKMSLQE